jgi:hypothetical protein
MTPRGLRNTLARLERPIGLVPAGTVLDAGYLASELRHKWRAAAAEANAAYEDWRARRDAGSYAVYRACADRADAAQHALAEASSRA